MNGPERIVERLQAELDEAREEILLLRARLALLSDDGPLVESLAALEHARWAHWMEYLFSCCTWKEDPPRLRPIPGAWLESPTVPVMHLAVIPADKVDRWQHQLETDYSSLTEKEKESDRIEVRKTLALIRSQVRQ